MVLSRGAIAPWTLSVPSFVIPGTYLENVLFLEDFAEIRAVELLFYLYDPETRELLIREREGLAARRASERVKESHIQKLREFFKGLKISDQKSDIEKYGEEDRRFHNFLIEIGGDELLSGILETYSIVTFSYLVGFLGGLVRPPKETLPEHLAIIEAIVDRDPERAEQATRLHLKRSREEIAGELANEKRRKGKDRIPR